MAANTFGDLAVPPIPDDARVFRFPAGSPWIILFGFLALSAASVGAIVFLFRTDDPYIRLILAPTALFLGYLVRITLRSFASSRNGVAVSDDGIWYLRRGGSKVYLEWREIAEVRAHDFLQRLVLSDATGTKSIRLEYQLRGFESLRSFVLAHTVETRQFQLLSTNTFHRSFANTMVMLLVGVFLLYIGFVAYQEHVARGFFVSVVIGSILLGRVILSPVSVSVAPNEVVVTYLGWKRTIPFSAMTGIFLSDRRDRGNVWVAVVIQQQGKKPIRLPQFREGSVAVYATLLRAWKSAGGGLSDAFSGVPRSDESDLGAFGLTPESEPRPSATKKFRLAMLGVGLLIEVVAVVLMHRGFFAGHGVRSEFAYPKHQGAIANVTELKGTGRIYLVQLGEHTSAYSLEDFAGWLHAKYGLDVRLLPVMKVNESAWNPSRHQYIAELLYQRIKLDHPDLAADEDAYLIGFTDADMYSTHYAWHSTFTQRDSMRSAVISTHNMGDTSIERARYPNGSDSRFQARLRRILLKDVAVLYWHLKVNYDPTSLLHDTLDPDLPVDDIYESDVHPELEPAGEVVDEPCVIMVYSAKNGLKILPGPLVRGCADVPDPVPDPSVELFTLYIRNGLLVDRHTDFYLPDVIPIQFERVTRDGWPASHPIGRSGSDNYDEFICGTDSGLRVVEASGAQIDYARYPSWLPVQSLVKYVNNRGEFIVWRGDPAEHFDLKDVGGGISTYLACPTSATRCFFDGYRDAVGRVLKVDRDGMRNLIQLTSPNGSWVRLNHGPQGRIAEIFDSGGRRVRYDYDERNRLTTVTYPSGEEYQYSYDDTQHLLSFSIAQDAHSAPREILRNEYRNGLLAKQILANNSVYEYEYQVGTDGSIRRATVGTPDGRAFRVDLTSGTAVIHETTDKRTAAAR